METSAFHTDMRNMRLALLLAACFTAHHTGAAMTGEGQNRPEIQADVYNELYEAHVECDEEFGQSRSEFIVEMFRRNRGAGVSRDLLRKLLLHNIQIARQVLKETRKARERYVSERMKELESESQQDGSRNDRFGSRQEQLRLLDERILARSKYVEVNLCVLATLQ